MSKEPLFTKEQRELLIRNPITEALRNAALWRHRVLVNFWYPPGSQRDAQHLYHLAIVRQVYGW